MTKPFDISKQLVMEAYFRIFYASDQKVSKYFRTDSNTILNRLGGKFPD